MVTLANGHSLGIYNIFRYSNPGQDRDSGGPVYLIHGGNLHLIGLHFATNSSTGVACRISYVMHFLNVTPITNEFFIQGIVGNNSHINGINITSNEHPVGRFSIPGQLDSRNVTQIGEYAFFGRTGITKVTLPNTLQSIGNNAFLFTGIWINTENNRVFYADKWAVGYKGTITNSSGKLEILSGTVGIGDSAFSQVSGLVEAAVPSGVIYIGANAFSNNHNLQSVWIPSTVNSIGEMAFSNCSLLEIYAQAASKPAGWHANWNPNNRPVNWNSPAPFQ